MNKLTRLFHLFAVCALLLSACNLPSDDPEGAEASGTFAAQTVEALLKTTPTATTTVLAPETFTPTPTTTSTPTPSATPVCPQAQFVTDVTIPDGTIMNPGQAFTKKWRIRNTGVCAWNGYSLVFDSGDAMSGPASKPIGSVNPGQEIDLDVNLNAPNTAGNYRGYWRIVSNNNVLVPMLNGYQGRAFYVDIKVQAPPTATNTTAPIFAVTSITYSLGTWGDGINFINCPRVTANITTNAAGTVTFKWTRQDTPGGGAPQNLVFAAAGTQSVNYDWTRGSVWAGTATWVGIYVVTPNNQDFGKLDFNSACTLP